VKETPEQKKLKTVQQQGDILKRLLVIQKEKVRNILKSCHK